MNEKADNRISVIVPVYNRAYTLGATLQSIALQTVLPTEVVVVDNNSTDGGMDIARQFAETVPFEMRFASCKKQSAAAARNVGAEMATGDWLLFFDSDDIMYPRLVATYNEAINRNDVARIIVVPQEFKFLNGTRKTVSPPLHGDCVVSQIMHTLITTNNMIVSRDALYGVGGWNEELPSWNDWELGVRLLLKYAPETLVLRNIEPQLCHVLQADSITGVGYAHHLDQCLKAIGVVEKMVRDSLAAGKEQDTYNLLLEYKRIMLAAQCKKEGDSRWRGLRNGVLDNIPGGMVRILYKLIFEYISKGLPGGSHIALGAIRLHLR